MSEQSPPSVEDDALVARARAGDLLAFEELVRLYADRLCAVVRRLVDDQHEAEEITQEAFLRAWRGPAAWSRTICAGRSSGRYRG